MPRWLLVFCVVLFARPVHPQGAQQCLPPKTTTPSTCTVKRNGLDILCEFTEQQHIQKGISAAYNGLRQPEFPRDPESSEQQVATFWGMPKEIMEPILDTLRVVDIMDNPLICDCDLAWYESWLSGLRDRDDEMMQKKRTICTMVSEHREYSVAKMPLEKMSCKRKPGYGRTSRASDNSPTLAYVVVAVIARWL